MDIGKPGVIIKPLITGAPTATEDGEWYYMIETAADNYIINKSRLLRYAGRRGKKETIENKLKEWIEQSQLSVFFR